MKTPMLFDLPPSRLGLRARITAFKKKHGILTERCAIISRQDHPWVAILPADEDKGKNMAEIMAESCRLYDEQGWVATGEGELSAIRELCRYNNIPCDL